MSKNTKKPKSSPTVKDLLDVVDQWPVPALIRATVKECVVAATAVAFAKAYMGGRNGRYASWVAYDAADAMLALATKTMSVWPLPCADMERTSVDWKQVNIPAMVTVLKSLLLLGQTEPSEEIINFQMAAEMAYIDNALAPAQPVATGIQVDVLPGRPYAIIECLDDEGQTLTRQAINRSCLEALPRLARVAYQVMVGVLDIESACDAVDGEVGPVTEDCQ